MLRVRGFRQTAEMFRCETREHGPDDLDESTRCAIRQISRAVKVAARNGLRAPNCLRSSLVLNSMLRRRGYGSVLRIGVSREGGQFEAHAWVELAGRVVNDANDIATRFVPIAELSGEAPFVGDIKGQD